MGRASVLLRILGSPGVAGFEALLSNHNCFSFLELKLPESGKYDVELIDTWEMTRKIVMSGVSSEIKVMLPGKEGTSKKGIS